MMLRLVVGRDTGGRLRVLYCGESAVDAQTAVDQKWDEYHAIQVAEVPFLRRARRSQALILKSIHHAQKSGGEPKAAETVATITPQSPVAPEQPGAAGVPGGDEPAVDGPVIDVPAPRRSRARRSAP